MILKQLRETSSNLTKEAILRKADTFDKKMFQYAYNPDMMYGVKYNYINWQSVRQPHQMDFILLDKLASRLLYGNGAREAIQKHCEEYGDLVKLICNKDLDCGVTATTLNKVFGKGFIPVFKVQLAVEVPIKDVKVPCIGQIKYNGVRVLARIGTHEVTFKTRNGKTFQYPALEQALLENSVHYKTEDLYLDGELTIGDSQGTNHTDVNINSAIRGNPIKGTPYTFTVFDLIRARQFDLQQGYYHYADRFMHLENVVNTIDSPLVKLAETFEFEVHEDIEAKFGELIEHGYEGLILKQWHDMYEYKRSKTWIKLKDIKTADLTCVGFEDGTGKYQDAIGALVCEGEVEGKDIKVSVGSGLSDAQRFMEGNTAFLDKTIEVKYNDVIWNTLTDSWSLFLPRFVSVRHDK